MGATTTSASGPGARRLPPRQHATADRPRGHRTSEAERRAVVAIAVLSGVAAAIGPTARPTSWPVTDALVLGGLAALVSLAASRARRWTWLVLAGLAAVAAPGWWLAPAGAALVLAFVTALGPRRRIYGALIGGLAVQALLRLGDVGFERSSAVLFLLAVVPVLGSAYLVSPRRVRRRIHWSLLAVGGFVVVATALFGVASALAYGSTQTAVREARNGLSLAREGKGDQAGTALAQAAAEFDHAHDLVGAWWTAPAGAVPLLSQQADAVRVLTDEGGRVADAAAQTAQGADVHRLRYQGGRVDVAKLRSLQAPLESSAAVFRASADRVATVRSPWLLAPIAQGVDDLERELHDNLPDVELAADAAREGPGLLGADGTRHYLVLFTQPAESRGLGGFVGNWAELAATDGKLELTRHGRAKDLNETPGRDTREVTSPPAPADYVERYSRFRPGYFVQDLTLSPDLPSVAAVAAELYPQMGGDAIDGVLVVDPYGLAALLKITGKVDVPGLPGGLTAENAADYLVRRQYVEAGDDRQRVDVLDDAGRLTFEKLVKGDLPGPAALADILGPAVAQRRIAFHPFDKGEQSLLAELHADGAFPARDGGDFFELVTQNKGNNKIDPYLKREVDYAASYAPGTGTVEATAKIRLRNEAPSSGLPASVIGSNDQGLPPGTNRLYLSFYSPLGLREAKVDGQPTPVEYQRELGYSVFSRFVDIPPGGTVELELSLFGHLDTGGTYRLGVGVQPLVNPDKVAVRLLPTGDWAVQRADGLQPEPGGTAATRVFQPTQGTTLTAVLDRP